MHRRTPIIIMLVVPLYVLMAFATTAFAPMLESLRALVIPEKYQTSQGPLTLTFVGDMMFDRYIRERATLHGYGAIIASTTSLFASSTHVFGNLEGPITSFASVSDYRDGGPNHYRFTFATTVAETLSHTGFHAVTLGNNHSTNFGLEGVAQTKQWLEMAGVGYVGAPDDPITPWRSTTGNRELAVYAYNPWHVRDVEPLMSRIQGESTETMVIVMAHWGEEYDTIPNIPEQTLAHRFVDAGADFVVGSHPHVIQSKEQYHGVWIYYSLGNFVFDQYFSPEVRCGAVVTLTVFADGTASTTEAFVELARDGTTVLRACKDAVPLL